MKKLLLFLAIILVVIGGVLLAVSIKKSINGAQKELITKEYELNDAFDTIDVDLNTADLEILTSPDGVNRVVCKEYEDIHNEVTVKDNKLVIKSVDDRKFYNRVFSFRVFNQQVIIYLNETSFKSLQVENETGDIKVNKAFTFETVKIKASTGSVVLDGNVLGEVNISVSTGDIYLDDNTLGSLQAKTSTGAIKLNNVNVLGDIKTKTSTGKTRVSGKCENFYADATTGDVIMENFIVSGEIKIEATTGDVTIDRSDAKSFYIHTSTGDVRGNVLTEKSFYAYSGSGRISVPKTSGDVFEVHTSTGNIKLEISK